MTRSNRLFNRVILFVIGVVALAAAGMLALPLVPARSAIAFVGPIQHAVSATNLLRFGSAQTLEWVSAGIAVVLIVVAIVWIVTRGRGRTRVAIPGDLSVDARVADDLVRAALSTEPDVIASSTSAYRVRGTTVMHIRVEARRGADLRRLTDAVRRVVDQLDLALGTAPDGRLPVLVHVSTGLRASLTREHRVA